MTLQGTVSKTGILLTLVAVCATYTWNTYRTDPAGSMAWLLVGLVGGFDCRHGDDLQEGMGSLHRPPAYAVLEGLMLGALSASFEARYRRHRDSGGGPDVWNSALAMLIAYTSGLVKVTQNFRMGVVAATHEMRLGMQSPGRVDDDNVDTTGQWR